LWRRDAESKVQVYEKRKQNIFARGECHFAIETIREFLFSVNGLSPSPSECGHCHHAKGVQPIRVVRGQDADFKRRRPMQSTWLIQINRPDGHAEENDRRP
jgi:hypothetical protein